MATKKLKLDEEAISEILVADTDSESVAKVSDVEEEYEEETSNHNKNNNNNNNNNYYYYYY